MMFTRNMFTRTLLLLFATSLGCSSAFAQRGNDPGGGPHGQRGGGPHGHGDGPHFRGGAHEGAWRSGHWEHGRIRGGGRTVWWWAPGPAFYYYPTPAYPYPYAYSYPYPYPPAYDPGAPPPPSVSYWFYCDAAGGYYPYVTQCPGGFRTIAPGDPNAPAPAPPSGVISP